MINSIETANQLVPKEELIKVYKTVLLAQEIHEESWDDHKHHYTKTHDNSAEEAVKMNGLDIFWISIITNWNYNYWNDIQMQSQCYLEQNDIFHNSKQLSLFKTRQ